MRKFLACSMIAVAALVGSAALSPSNAASKILPKAGGDHQMGGGHSGGDGDFDRHRGHHRDRDFGFFFGAPFIGSYVYNGDTYSCGWLHRRAVRTGNPYWWDRYEACRYGY